MTLVREYQPTFVLGDGETKEFSYLFEEVSENFIKVIVKHSDDSTYTPVFSVDLDSHKVVFGESETAPLDTDLVCIYRETPDLQDTPFRTLQGYDAKALENILSKIVAMIQELKANGFSTQILQGTPWQLDLLHPTDDNASVVIDYNARILKKGLYFQIVSGNLQVSADGSSFITMPKSADITEFRCLETVLEDLTVVRKLQYKVSGVWYDAESNAQATADQALNLAQTVQGDLSSHKLNHNNPHQTNVANLTDTEITNPALGHFLRFDGTKWVNSSSDVTSVDWGEIEGDIADQTDLKNALDSKVNIDGTSIMTAPLKFMSGSVRGAVGPYFNGVGFWKLDSQGNLTQIASISDSQFIPTTTNAIDIGNSTKKWKNLYLSGKAFVSTINNGADINIPTVGGKMAVQVSTMPTASADNVGDVVQFVGATDANYTNGYFYKSTENSGTYSWVQTDIQPSASGLPDQTGNSGKVLTTDGTDASWTDTLATLKLSTALKASDGSNIVEVTGSGNFTFGRVLKTITLNSSFIPYASGSVNLGNATYKFGKTYTQKINNGSDIVVPNQAGTMVVADPTGATQGQVLTLDSNLKPAWADASSGSSYHPDLFDWKWADHQLNDVQWLRADTFSWQSGSVYQAAYKHLRNDMYNWYSWANNGTTIYTKKAYPEVGEKVYSDSALTTEVGEITDVTDTLDITVEKITVNGVVYDSVSGSNISPTTETVGGVTVQYIPAEDGHKIVTDFHESEVADVYTATGVAWYYIIDYGFKRFKLPRTKFGVTGLRDAVGNYIAPGLPDHNHTISSAFSLQNYSAANYGAWDFIRPAAGNTITPTTNASDSNSIYGKSTTVQPPATEMYLYFYVGEFTQTAIENTAGLNAELFNEKVDVGHQVIAFQAPTAQNNYTWYRKYADGWVEQGGQTSTGGTQTLPITMADTNYNVMRTNGNGRSATTANELYTSVGARTTTTIYLVLESSIAPVFWQVSGMAAS